MVENPCIYWNVKKRRGNYKKGKRREKEKIISIYCTEGTVKLKFELHKRFQYVTCHIFIRDAGGLLESRRNMFEWRWMWV